MLFLVVVVFFFKQKTAYEMRISDWSSDVCSSDLAFFMEADVALVGIVAAFTVVKAGRGGAGRRILGLELKARGQNLLHKQAGGDGFERVVDRLGHGGFSSIRLRDQVGETGASLARRVAGGATDDLHDLGQAGPIADRQRMFAPNPVKAFLRHAERDDDVNMIAIVLLRGVFERGGNPIPPGCVIVHKVSAAKDAPFRRLDQLEAGGRRSEEHTSELQSLMRISYAVFCL